MLKQISSLYTSVRHLLLLQRVSPVVSSIHTTHFFSTQHKDVTGDYSDPELDHDSGTSEVEQVTRPIGLTEYGFICPTLESHSQLFNGVPYNELPIMHIKCSPNNTLITVTNHTGLKTLTRTSCGTEGFKNAKKKTNVACQATGLAAGQKALKQGVHTVRVAIKGVGAGRLATIKGLHNSGIKIISLTDRTPIAHAGPRPRKARRL